MKQDPQTSAEARDVAPGLWRWRLEHPHDATHVWERLDARPPTAVVILKPDHIRDVDLFVRRYKARAYGPRLFSAATYQKPSWSLSSPAASFKVE